MSFLRCAVLSIAAAGLLGGCATTQKVEMGSTDIDQAHREVPANQLLDVGIPSESFEVGGILRPSRAL